MPMFRNTKNVHLAGPVEVKPEYDAASRTYVATLAEADAKKLRGKLADEYGYVEESDD